MNQTERLYQIELLIKSRGHASFAELQGAVEVSRATLWRDIEFLRSRLGAPIEYDRDVRGYRFAAGHGAPRGAQHELPGLWFSERELYSLLMAHQLLSGLDTDGMLSRHLQPLLDRIHHLLGTASGPKGGGHANRPNRPNGPHRQNHPGGAQALIKRVRIISAARRPVPARYFELVGEALLNRRRIHLRYLTRGRGEVGERDVSPQRLVHHRNTWYLDAWCHRVDALRRFALDAIESATLLDTKAREVAMKTVQASMDAGYGIYAGGEPRWATLHFEATAAQWISREEWHAQQQGRWLDDGRYELRLPYVDETELVMDLLRQGDEVEVIAPASLRDALAGRLVRAAARYAAPARAPR